MNVFDCAIKIETDMKNYYEGLEAESRCPEMKNLFSLLAATEEEHCKNLARLKASTATAAKAKLDGLDVSACSYRPFLTHRELLEGSANDPDLYRFTVQEEENEIRFFEHLAEMAKDDLTRGTLLMLAAEERRHLETLENIYEFVEAPKSFLAWGEFGNLREF